MARGRGLPLGAYALAALGLVALYLALSIRVTDEAGPRPVGGLEELRALAGRDDLNLVFVVVDTLRAERLGAYGYERDTTPTLDAMARGGILFANHLSQSSWTKTSMASLWTGLYPRRNRVLRYDDAVSPEARMPAEVLKEHGFHTYAIWRNGWVAPNFGFDQGFDAYHNPHPIPIPPSVRKENPSLRNEGSDHEILLSALEFLRTHGDERFLLYLHLMDVHQYVYDEESALFGTTYSDIYDNSIRRTDNHLAILLAGLEQAGLRDETIVVLVSDHGEAFGEHGFEGHAKDLYAEVTRTPWVLSLPFRLEPGVVVTAPSENVDVWPTLYALLGLPAPEDLDGRSRLPELLASAQGDTDGGEDARISEIDQHWGQTQKRPRPLVSVTEGRYRLFFDAGQPGRLELYDVEADPGEQRNLAGEEPDVAARLAARAVEHLAAEPPEAWQGGAPKVEIDDMQLRQLRALGYDVD